MNNLFITYFARADNMLLPFTRGQITWYCPRKIMFLLHMQIWSYFNEICDNIIYHELVDHCEIFISKMAMNLSFFSFHSFLKQQNYSTCAQ